MDLLDLLDDDFEVKPRQERPSYFDLHEVEDCVIESQCDRIRTIHESLMFEVSFWISLCDY